MSEGLPLSPEAIDAAKKVVSGSGWGLSPEWNERAVEVILSAGLPVERTRWAEDDMAISRAAHRLDELRHAEIGADLEHQGCYAVYFYDPRGERLLVRGGYHSARSAANAVSLIRAKESMIASLGLLEGEETR